MLRAIAVRSGETESSKSKIKASAEVLMDLASFFSLSPGTKSSERSMCIKVQLKVGAGLLAAIELNLYE